MYAEVTREVFNQIVHAFVIPETIEQKELCRKTYYVVYGVRFLMLENYLSGVTQYYIQDINA